MLWRSDSMISIVSSLRPSPLLASRGRTPNSMKSCALTVPSKPGVCGCAAKSGSLASSSFSTTRFSTFGATMTAASLAMALEEGRNGATIASLRIFSSRLSTIRAVVAVYCGRITTKQHQRQNHTEDGPERQQAYVTPQHQIDATDVEAGLRQTLFH